MTLITHNPSLTSLRMLTPPTRDVPSKSANTARERLRPRRERRSRSQSVWAERELL